MEIIKSDHTKRKGASNVERHRTKQKRRMKVKIKIIAGLISLSLITACSNADRAHEALEKAGFREIQAGGHSWFSCSKTDFYSTKFKAKNSNGIFVEGAVCSGLLFKGSVVRF